MYRYRVYIKTESIPSNVCESFGYLSLPPLFSNKFKPTYMHTPLSPSHIVDFVAFFKFVFGGVADIFVSGGVAVFGGVSAVGVQFSAAQSMGEYGIGREREEEGGKL